MAPAQQAGDGTQGAQGQPVSGERFGRGEVPPVEVGEQGDELEAGEDNFGVERPPLGYQPIERGLEGGWQEGRAAVVAVANTAVGSGIGVDETAGWSGMADGPAAAGLTVESGGRTGATGGGVGRTGHAPTGRAVRGAARGIAVADGEVAAGMAGARQGGTAAGCGRWGVVMAIVTGTAGAAGATAGEGGPAAAALAGVGEGPAACGVWRQGVGGMQGAGGGRGIGRRLCRPPAAARPGAGEGGAALFGTGLARAGWGFVARTAIRAATGPAAAGTAVKGEGSAASSGGVARHGRAVNSAPAARDCGSGATRRWLICSIVAGMGEGGKKGGSGSGDRTGEPAENRAPMSIVQAVASE